MEGDPVHWQCTQEKLSLSSAVAHRPAKCTDRQWQSQFALRCDSGILPGYAQRPQLQFAFKREQI